MVRTSSALAACLLLALVAPADDKNEKAKAELKRLQGRWKVASTADSMTAIAKDKLGKIPGASFETETSYDDAVIAVDGDRLVWSSPVRKWDGAGEWVVALDPAADPKVLRLTRPPLKPGQPKWKVEKAEAIYELKGDTLRLGFNFGVGGDKGLPDSFDLRKGRVMVIVLTFEHVKAEK